MIRVKDALTVLDKGALLTEEEAQARSIAIHDAQKNSLAAKILDAHSVGQNGQGTDILHIRFDALASHDITYVGIIQTARASGLTSFPIPYVLTNCHNSLCAVGGTINEDDHIFGLSAAKKYGAIFVPTNCAVIHQYMREAMVYPGSMVLGSDSHTRYGALGSMGIGEGGPELVKQLLKKTYDVARPRIVCVWLTGSVTPGVGPQDVAIALIREVFSSGFVKNAVLEFHGPGIKNLSVEFRSGIDVMTTETTCLSSIWETDELVREYYADHGREECYKELALDGPAAFDGCIEIDLGAIKPMIALPFHPSNAWPIEEVIRNAPDMAEKIEKEARARTGHSLKLQDKWTREGIWVDQAIIAGCAGGSFENLAIAAQILENKSIGNGAFSLSLYPASQVVALDLVRQGYTAKAMLAGALIKNAFCGPCFGAGDTPANGTLSIRHSTRNFPNREGSKPGEGQMAAVALMDARSIAATAANGGKLTQASDLPEKLCKLASKHKPEMALYASRVYTAHGNPKPSEPLILGPNITDWPTMRALPENLVLCVASVLTDPVTTTDELIPSGETSSLRSNPLRLAEFTLQRADPNYVGLAKEIRALEKERQKGSDPAKNFLRDILQAIGQDAPLDSFAIGSTIAARKPGDGSAREQAASSQKVLGGAANLAIEYATKRYRSNLINWGMLPFLVTEDVFAKLSVRDTLVLLGIRTHIAQQAKTIPALHRKAGEKDFFPLTLTMQAITDTERDILLAGCLINFYQAER
ncbi:MAG: hydratase [Desulfovibrionaceae bacterium]|nr:hydratase [Desulfovibrionaceae bacterium]